MIQLEHVSKKHQQPLFEDFSYNFPEKGIVCFFGPSGSGKTTLLNLILGLETPDSGRIQGTEGKRTSVVFQEDRLLPWFNGLENILAVNENFNFCWDWIQKFGMEAEVSKFPDEMSGGLKRQIAILRALAYDGDLFFLDEPFQALDLVKRKEIIELLRSHLSNKLTIFITHHLEEVLAMADVLLIFHGEPLKIIEEIHRKDFTTLEEMSRKISSFYAEKKETPSQP